MLPSTRCTIVVGIIMLCCNWWELCESQQQGECSLIKLSDIKAYVIGTRDEIGTYVNTIKISLGTENGRDAISWTEDLKNATKGCRGTTLTQIRIDVTAKPNPSYQHFPRVGYYKFHATPKTWEEGRKMCEQEGGHLAIINSDQESKVLKLMLSQHPNIIGSSDGAVAAIGFHDMYREGDFQTIHGEPLFSTGFVEWSPVYNSPDNFQGSETNPGEDCGSIYRDGLLNDISCDGRYTFICEQELARPKVTSTVCVDNFRPV